MKVPSRTMSRPSFIACPRCGCGELRAQGADVPRCDLCGCATGSAILETLVQIATLPDALGKHACECGHPEMRRLPDGVFHCPACGSEVIPPERLRAIKSGELSWKKRVFRKGGGRLAIPA